MKNFFKTLAVIVVLLFGFFLFITSNDISGIRSFIVKSGSMEPIIPTGALVVTQYTHPVHLKKDDVITFIRPTEERDFITHRILDINTRNDYTSIQTKGDNNKTPDNWKVGGGNVVGKVNFMIPYLGYILTFVQSKVGILLFILIPAIYILVEEISNIIKLFRKNEHYVAEPVETSILLLALLFGFGSVHTGQTQALLSDSVVLKDNQFVVTLHPTITPAITPKPSSAACGGITTININGNGAGSNNSVSVQNNCPLQTVTQTNQSNVTNTVTSTTTTGGNKTEFNTVSTVLEENRSTITTGEVSSDISVSVTGESNVLIKD